MITDNHTTESIINDLKFISRYPQNIHVPYICRLAADRLELLDSYNANLQAANTGLSCDLEDMARELEAVKAELDALKEKQIPSEVKKRILHTFLGGKE